MPWRVTGREDRLEGANAVTIAEEARGARFRPGESNQFLPGFTSIQREIASEEAGFSLANDQLDLRELENECIKRAQVIDMCMSQGNAPDRCIETVHHFYDGFVRMCKAGVNESEAIVFADQKTIDHAEASQAKQVFGFLFQFHSGTREAQ